MLRIEDTDVARSTQDSVDQILASMHWLGLDYDEGPIYQMQRLDALPRGRRADDRRRHRLPLLLHARRARRDARGAARARREDALRRPLAPRAGQDAAAGAGGRRAGGPLPQPARRRRDWDDLVKGPITIANREIDDLIIVRADGVPTYNFAVVVDDWDMAISHVFRGDEHINNTPWQINIFNALGAPLPLFGHCPIILGDDGLEAVQAPRRGQRHRLRGRTATCPRRCSTTWRGWAGATATRNCSAREQMVQWFDGSHLSKSPAQWDPAKLGVGQRALHQAAPTTPRWPRWSPRSSRGAASPRRPTRDLLRALRAVQGPLRTDGRAGRLARDVLRRCRSRAPRTWHAHVTDAVRPALRDACATSSRAVEWDKAGDRRGDQGDAGRARPEDAAARAGGARAGLRPRADAVDRRGARSCSRASTVLARALRQRAEDAWL